MFDTKIEVDRHVDNCLKKINDENERNLRSFAFAKLYFKVGDYEQARRYVSCYLSAKPLSTEGFNLLGKTLEKQGKSEQAVEAYRKSLDIDSKQNSLLIKICELLASEDVGLDVSGARYYCEKAQSFDPHNPIIFSLKERVIAAESKDPNDVSELLLSEVKSRPTDVYLRVRLLHHLLHNHRIKEAYQHICEVELLNLHNFANNLNWYETIAEVLIHYPHNKLVNSNITWEFWILLVSVLDRLVALTLAEHTNSLKSSAECAQVVFDFDQTLTTAVANIRTCTEKPFIQEFLNHYQAQLCFHFMTLLFKQLKRELIKYRDVIQLALPALFASYHTKPAELRSIWLDSSTDVRRQQVHRWHKEAAFRCSQSGHILLALAKDQKLTVMEKAKQSLLGLWREQVFKKVFVVRDQQEKLKSSYFVTCPNLVDISTTLPEINDINKYDEVSQLLHPDSLHLFIWLCLHKALPTFCCTVFEGLQYSIKNLNNCAAESLNILDIESFLYCASLCASQRNETKLQANYNKEPSNVFPASVTDLLGTINQSKWLRAAYKVYKNEYGAELSELRLVLIRGIEVVRCVGNHGLDVKVLVTLASTFAERAKNCTKQTKIDLNDARAELYWKSALPLLEKLEKNQAVTYASNRLFEYKSKEMTQSEIALHIEEAKLFIAGQFMKKKEYEKALQLYQSLKSPYASFYQAVIYKTMANEQLSQHKENVTSEMRSQHVILLSRCRDCFYLTMDRLRDPSVDRKHPLNNTLGTEIEKIERLLSRYDSDVYNRHEDGMSDVSSAGSNGDPINNSYFSVIGNSFHYNEPATPIYENRQRIRIESARKEARPSPERLDAQLRQMQASRDATINQVLDQNRLMIESHRNLVDELRNFRDAVTHLTSTVEDLKTAKNTVNEELKSIKDTVSELKTSVDAFNLADVSDVLQEMRKEIAELKKDKNKHNPLSDEDLYGLDDDYGAEYNFNPNNLYPNLPGRMPSSSVPFPPTLFQSLYPIYPYAGLGIQQAGTLPYAQDTHLNDLRVLNSISQGIPQTSFVQPSIPTVMPQIKSAWDVGLPQPTPIVTPPSGVGLNTSQQASALFKDTSATVTSPVPVIHAPTLSTPSSAANASNAISTTSNKAPVNVVITSSDPLPTTSVQTTQILSVTIPPQHLKGTKKLPHDYQISLPSSGITTLPATPSIMNQPSPIISTEGLLMNVAPPVYSAVNISKSPKSSELGLHIEKVISHSFGSNKEENSFNKSNVSNTSLDEHDPRPDFKPVIPLPEEVPVTTGEENEKVLFCERAKLFRFVNKEWKDRGVGNLKILKNEQNGKVRILMRRDHVHKICANHFLTKDMLLTLMAKSDRAYVWAANDYADGEMVVEKLCVRFKTEEQASKFYAAFEKAKLELPTIPVDKELSSDHDKLDKIKSTLNSSIASTSSLGGFIFTGTPTFKPSIPTVTPSKTPVEQEVKSSPFATFTFGTKVSSSTPTNIFSTTTTHSQINTPQKEIPSHKLSPKTPEEFVPTAEFTPAVTLPDIVEVKTGEEDSEVLFVGAAKLLRFETITREWKERGTGDIKLLKQNNSVRILMRRDQVHKVCCNHQLLKNMSFSKMPKNPKAMTWTAQDFSENVFKPEIFTVRFKTEQQTDAFATAIKLAQNSLDENNCIKSGGGNKNAITEDKQVKNAKTESPKAIGWDDKFKPKQGHWECKNCYVVNEGKSHQCVACETSKPNLLKSPDASSQFSFGSGISVSNNPPSSFTISTPPSSGFLFGQKAVPATTLSWGDAFKPKEGSWECSECLLRNDGDKLYCLSCENPKEGLTSNEIKNSVNLETPGLKFSFGMPTKVEKPTSWGDLFKPKEGTWECKLCYVRNDMEKLYCLSCESPKDDTVPQKDKGIDLSTAGLQFKFGIPQSTNSASTFSFTPNSTFNIPKAQNTSETFSFGVNKKEDSESSGKFVFGSPQQHNFEFTPRSPRRHSSGCQGDEESDHYVEDEDENIYFKPIIPLPDKVEVKSGEEEEQVLYCHRAKLFRYVEGEWKERGIGDIKILYHADKGKLRILMRREQVLKICLNHNLTPEIEYLPKDDKTWLFSAPDYSEGEVNQWRFCIRFKNGEIAQQFKQAIADALLKINSQDATVVDDDVLFVSETKVSPEEEQEALRLKLPKNFMLYRQLPDCTCETCKNEDAVLGITTPQSVTSQTTIKESTTLKSILTKPFLPTNTTATTKPAEKIKEIPLSANATTDTENKNSFSNFSFTLKSEAPQSTVTFGSTGILATPKFSFNNPSTAQSTLSTGSIFSSVNTTTAPTSNIFGNKSTQNFDTAAKSLFGSSNITPTISASSISSISSSTTDTSNSSKTSLLSGPKGTAEQVVLKYDSGLDFAALAAKTTNAFATVQSKDNNTPFASLGAGKPVFGSLTKSKDTPKGDKHESDNEAESTEPDHDPHFEPIVPLPAVIEVSTGEEDETAKFNERAKLFRFNIETKEWKERGVGQFKILFHPAKGTYRFLLRREQIHKIVLNMLISPNLELLPMSTSDKSWIWVAHNYIDGETTVEKLAVRFKTGEMAQQFYKMTMEAVAEVKKKQETSLPSTVQYFENVSAEQNESEEEDDEDERSVMFMKNCIFNEQLDGGGWKHVCNGFVQLYYDPETYGSRVSITDESGEVVSTTIVGQNTEIISEGTSCIWKAVEWLDDGKETPRWRIFKLTFDDAESQEGFYCSFLESIQYAIESDLVDGIFIENDDE